MTSQRLCRKCGNPLAADAPKGLCLKCLLDTALEDAVHLDADGASDGVTTDDSPSAVPSGKPGAPSLETSGADQPTGPQLQRFGDYELIEEIGRGGMGVVYKAHQLSLDRLVALKTILFGPLATPEQIRRFRTEASAAAALQHPNIVAVHEVGVHQNQHYLVMDLVDGPNLGRLVRDKPLPARQAATYLKAVAEAIHFAHERGILHRDLKPSNVLVGSDDRPRVADFGLARRLGTDSSLTLTGQMLGSPNYMPPEQAAGGGGKVGRPADVYGLGAILYHLLTARPPFQAETIPQTIQLVTSAEPLSPRVLVPSVPRDLETICLKCLEKDPAKRYPTAQALVEELDRFLKGEPILARPVGPTGKAWRWCRRKPAAAAALTVSLASLLVIAVVSSVFSVRTNRARQAERLEAYYSAIALANQYVQQGDIQTAKNLLFSCPVEFRHWEWGHLMFLCHQDVLSIDMTSQASAADTSSEKRFARLSFSPDGSALITQGADGTVKVWDTETGRIRLAVGGPAQPVHRYNVDSLGHRLAVGGKDGAIQVLDMASGREVLSVVHRTNVTCCTALSPAGRQLVTGGGGVVCVWDVERTNCLRRWEVRTEDFERFELSEDATRLVTQQGGSTRIWDVNTGAEVLSLTPRITNGLSYTVNGSVSAAVAFDTDNRVWLWRANGTCVDLGQVRGSAWESHRWASFAANGQLFCTGGDRCTARVWDALTARERFTLPGRITGAEFSPDSTRLLTRGEESVARIWDLGTAQEVRTLRGHHAIVEHACFSPNGRLVATADQDGVVKLWSASNGREVLAGDSWPWGACYSADGKRLASISNPVLDLRVWDSDSGAELLRFRPGMEHCCLYVRFSPDGRFLATGGAGGDVRLWDSKTGREVRRYYGHAELAVEVAFSPNGKVLAAGATDGTARLWDVESGNLLRVFQGPARGVTSLLFSPEGSRLYVGSADGFVRAYDPQSGRLQIQIGEPQSSAAMLTFSLTPDGRHLYTADSLNNTRRAWDTLTGRPLPGSQQPQRAGFWSTFTPATAGEWRSFSRTLAGVTAIVNRRA